MKIRFNIASYMTVYVTHKSGWWNVFIENFHFISQSVFLQTLLLMGTVQISDGVHYLAEHIFFKALVKYYVRVF
jgi:hypothetical protein